MIMRKGVLKKALAYILALCMIIGSVMWPDITAKAETVTLDLAPDTGWQTVTAKSDQWSDYGKAEMRFTPPSDKASLKAIADAGYKTLKIAYEVSAFTATQGENAGVMPFASYGANWSNNDEWVSLTSAGKYEAVLDLTAISTTSTEKVSFGIQIANLEDNSDIKFRVLSAVLVGTRSGSSEGDSGSESGESDETDLELIGTTSANVTAGISEGDGTAAGDGYYETEITINNKSNVNIADWIAVVDVNGAISGVKDYSSWSDLCGVFNGGKLYIYPNTSKKSPSVNTGASVKYSKLGYTGAANGVTLKGAKVYYSSKSGAFKNFIGSLSSTAGGAGDSTEEINTDVDYNYAKLLQESLYLYDANMCGGDVTAKSEFAWRSNCHTEDATATYKGKVVDVSGGYHDAGDHAKFGLPQAYSATVLGLAHMEFAEAFADTKTEAHYKRIMDRFVDYFERCTVLGSDGKVEAFCYQVGDGGKDHGYWGAPEKQPSRSGEATFTSDSDPCTDIVSETAAALAAYYINYKDEKALSYAEKLFAYADTKTKKCSAGPAYEFYKSDTWVDDYALAAALLYKATGKSEYASKYNNSGIQNPNWVMCWGNVGAAALLYSPGSSKKSIFVQNQSAIIAEKTQTGDNNFCLINDWGSARYNATHQMTGLMYDKIYKENDYSAWANGQMKYILGNNAGAKCFVVGYNKYSSKLPHHRAASGYIGSVTGNAYTKQAHVLVGALVGGPATTSKAYVDNAEDYNQNEVALDYNAGLVGAAAGLYLYVKNKGTDAEKAVQKVVPKSEVSSELRTIKEEIVEPTTTEASTEVITKATTEATTEVTTKATTEATTEVTTEATTEDDQKPEVVKVNKITLDRTVISLKVGMSDQIKATVAPANVADSSIVWSSSDRSKVSVQNGKITALAEGTAVITAKAKDGSGVTAKCTIKVSRDIIDISRSGKAVFKATNKTTYKVTYTGAKILPAVIVTAGGKTLRSGTDYVVSYTGNLNAGTASAVIKGKGGYKGSIKLNFTIAKRDIRKAKIAVSANVLFTGKAVKPATKVVYGKTVLVLGKSYKITCYSNINFGKAKVVISGIGNYAYSVVRYYNIITKVGKVYTCGNYKYKITAASTNGKGTVTLVSAVKPPTKLVVPDSIKLGGKIFKVTAIGTNAFKGNAKLCAVSIGKNVKSIGSKAFYGCKNLKSLTINSVAMTTKTVGSSAFTGTYAKIKVKVPTSKFTYYKKLLPARGLSKKAVIIK